MVRLRKLTPVELSTPTSERARVPAFRVLLLVPAMIVPLRSRPISVTLLLPVKRMISWYVPAAMVMVTAAVLLAGTRSMAPWTEQKGALPSRATVSAARLVGAAAAVLKRQAVVLVMASAPLGPRMAPESMVT